jgi:hypothetical protein
MRQTSLGRISDAMIACMQTQVKPSKVSTECASLMHKIMGRGAEK